MRAGQLDRAAQLWKEVLVAEPEHPQALFHLGQHALYRKDLATAQGLLTRAAAAAPKEAAIPLNLSFVFRATGDTVAELDALTRALDVDPYFFPALLAKGMVLERIGDKKQAARIYKDVVFIAPPDDQLPPDLKAPVVHARIVVRDNASALDAFLSERLKPFRERHAKESLARFEECREVVLGNKKVYTQQPSMLHVPALPAIQFYDEKAFPWLARLEAAADTIRDELLVVLREDMDEARPYVDHPAGSPVNQWAELNHSPRWSAFFLWEDSKRIDAHCARCPRTAAVLDEIP